MPGCSRFPTLVLPRSGSEGRPFGWTLSRVAPLASTENRIAGLLHCQRGIRPSRMLKKEGKGSLVVLLLAERARLEGARSTRAIEDRPGHPLAMCEKSRRPCWTAFLSILRGVFLLFQACDQ